MSYSSPITPNPNPNSQYVTGTTSAASIVAGSIAAAQAAQVAAINGVPVMGNAQTISRQDHVHWDYGQDVKIHPVDLGLLAKDINELLNGCAGRRTSEVIQRLVDMVSDAIERHEEMLPAYECIECGSPSCYHLTAAASTSCHEHYKMREKMSHKHCKGRRQWGDTQLACPCTCHAVDDTEWERTGEKLRRLVP